jgi:hypothetical protein
MKIYPNPIENDFRIAYALNEDSQEVNVKVFSNAGGLLKEIKNIRPYQLIKTDGLPRGNLILLIETKDTQRRFIYNVIKK